MDTVLRISVCDDDMGCIQDINKYIKLILSDFEFYPFNDGNELLKRYNNIKYPYDIVFMDIEMEGLNGVECANKIREADRNVIIIFVTSHTKYMPDCFECGAFRFLEKPVSFDTFKDVFVKALKNISAERKYICFKEGKDTIKLFYEEIMFFENVSHWVNIYTKHGVHKIYTTFNEILRKLDTNIFVKTHKSYIVNMDYIEKFNGTDIVLSGYKNPVPLSRNFKNEFKAKFLKMKERQYIL